MEVNEHGQHPYNQSFLQLFRLAPSDRCFYSALQMYLYLQSVTCYQPVFNYFDNLEVKTK